MTTGPTLLKTTDSYELWDWSNAHAALVALTDREVEALTTVAGEDICFSTTTGTGIEGVRVSCFRVLSHEPVLDGEWREALPGDGATLATRTEARKFGLASGYIVEYRRKEKK